MREINFDGLIGPSHNYAGLSLGNIASSRNAGEVSAPRAAALQGLGKMRHMLSLGITQGLFLPHDRPDTDWLRQLGFAGDDDAVCRETWEREPALLRNALSASAMWTANAATVSPAPDTADGRCHLTVANLSTMLHRSIEHGETLRQLQLAFGDDRYFVVHPALPAGLGDEGAANFMRMGSSHADRSLELFVYGERPAQQAFPARQHRAASAAVARRHGVSDADLALVRQSDEAVAAGAFHNDVVAVANENVLFAHEQAFADRDAVYRRIAERVPDAVIVEAPRERVSLEAAVGSYLFNSQLVTLGEGGMALILPQEARDTPEVWAWLQEVQAADNPIRRLDIVNVRESMRNGGGPACLRLRLAVSEEACAAIDSRFLLDERRCDRIEAVIERHWPERIAPDDLGEADLWHQCREARETLLAALDFPAGIL
ncbi:N-succinylarginine dihydrolase [Altericroceibacterium spongiae]|uniref:N-succinylarginine dihydrolase n=1 Tax=Altericroceibacterium spongiae TaxID=2320269 RepID=A0A420ERT2_9SPHN|nr:N-succinylarginine dihydrolase [Altericroceibacterium spongiae]RKF23333.1 N-succinylarginine dihydrolase [Altericroceibacterium spongiae]